MSLLRRALLGDRAQSSQRLSPSFPMEWRVDWDNFKKEYPHVQGTALDWQTRLAAALAPTFAEED